MYNDLRDFKTTKLVKYFDSKKDVWWNKVNNKKKEHIIGSVFSLICALDTKRRLGIDINLEHTEKAVGNYHEIPMGIITYEADRLSSYFRTGDSIIGTKLIGEVVSEEYRSGNVSINNFEDWIYENLWLWAQCTVSKEEHKAENIKRQNQHKITLEEKVNFRHYPTSSEILYD
jgi:hypothetical protein